MDTENDDQEIPAHHIDRVWMLLPAFLPRDGRAIGRAEMREAFTAAWSMVAELEQAKDAIGFDQVMTNTDVVKVSAVGIGMRSNAGIAATMFETLAERGINILAISTSEIKVSVLLPEEYTELAVRVLHTAFGLDAKEEAA